MLNHLRPKFTRKILLRILLLIIIGSFLFLVGNQNYSLFDNSETNYSAVAREIVNTGDWLTMHYNGQNWYIHPPLYFWMTSTLCKLFGWTEFNLRFWEGLFGVLGLIMTYLLARQFFANRIAFSSALILGTSFYYYIISRLAIFDTFLNFFILTTLYLFFKAYYNPTLKGRYFFFMAISTTLAVLTKGPVGLVHPFMVIIPFLIWKKDLKFLFDKKIWLNFLFFIALISPWYVIELTSHGWDFFNIALKDYTWYRFFGAVENQAGPWYYYFPVLLLFFPWIFFLPNALLLLSKKQTTDNKQRDFVQFSIFFLVITFIFFTLAGTKLPNYIFSVFPFLSILISASLYRIKNKIPLQLSSFVLLLFSLVLLWFSVFGKLPKIYAADQSWLIKTVILNFAIIFVLVKLLQNKKPATAIYSYTLCTILFVFYLTHFFLPAIEKYKDTKIFADVINKTEKKSYTIINFEGYSPALMYYLNHKVEHIQKIEELKQTVATEPGIIYIVLPLNDLNRIKQISEKTLVIKSGYQFSLIKIN
ncbi:MAG: glycosyltransferase family 39 protein [Candidatus Margulisbacteria bacterium]|nr:glycosyltransferase family 39 protein [Candidatus Margulisiibacteriota bacterium]